MVIYCFSSYWLCVTIMFILPNLFPLMRVRKGYNSLLLQQPFNLERCPKMQLNTT